MIRDVREAHGELLRLLDAAQQTKASERDPLDDGLAALRRFFGRARRWPSPQRASPCERGLDQ